MIKRIVLMLVLVTALSFAYNGSINAEKLNEVPEAAKVYAKENFSNILDSFFTSGDDPTLYNFEKDQGEITFGELIAVHGFTSNFLLGKSLSVNDVSEPLNEWYAVVYQNGKPKNIIGMYQENEENYSFSQLGFGEDLVMALDRSLDNQQLIFNGTLGDYYLFNPDKNQAFSIFEDKAYTELSIFQTEISEKYNQIIMESNGTDDSSGVVVGNNILYLLYWGLFGLVILCSFIIGFVIIKRKKASNNKPYHP